MNEKKPEGFLTRGKPKRWRRGMVSLDESLLTNRPGVHQVNAPLVKALAIPLAAPTMVAAPVGGKPLIDRLDPHDVIQARITDSALSAILMGFAQMRPAGVRSVALTRAPSLDVVVRLYHDSGAGVLYPAWFLARTHREAQAEISATAEATEGEEGYSEQKTMGTLFCQYVQRALGMSLKVIASKGVSGRLAAVTRCITGRNLAHIDISDKDRCWEAVLTAVCERRPVFAGAKETNPQHARRRRFAPNSPLVVLEAFELRGERFVCVFDPEGAADGLAPAPRDVAFDDFMIELQGIYVVA